MTARLAAQQLDKPRRARAWAVDREKHPHDELIVFYRSVLAR